MNLSNDPKAGRILAGLLVSGLLLFGASLNDPFHFDDVLITNDANGMNLKDATLDVSELKFRRGDGSYDAQGKPVHLNLGAAIAKIGISRSYEIRE